MEAAPNDQSDEVWINTEASNLVGNKTDIGKGKPNTYAIIHLGAHTGSAAKLCDDLEVGGYNDWFLPSKDELNKMYVNLRSGKDENNVDYSPVGGFANGLYWSSAEVNATFAWNHYFSGIGIPNINWKFDPYHVRAIRSF